MDTKSHNLAGLNSESACKLINRIPGLRLLISSLPGKALRTLVDIARLATHLSIFYVQPLKYLLSVTSHINCIIAP